MKGKIKRIQIALYHFLGNDKFSFHRLFIVLKSKRGQKKLWSFAWRTLKFIFGIKSTETKSYEIWFDRHYPKAEQLEQYRKELESFEFKPTISIILPVYNPPIVFFKKAIDSVKQQVYPHWELCISDDLSPAEEIRDLIKEYATNDKRIKYFFRKTNGHISENSNSALELATGEYISLLDHDDVLSPDALFQNVKALNADKTIDMLYSDEDKIDSKGNHLSPHFKQDWCPDSFLSRNYICHFSVFKKEIIKEVGGFRTGFEGSQDYDLLLRITEKAKNIHHIPKILYHWRLHLDSTSLSTNAKPYAYLAGVKAIQEALERRGIKGHASLIENSPGFYRIRYEIFNRGKVSIIIPSKNKADLCEVIISSVFKLTDYPDYEIILVNNNSSEQSFFDMVKKWEKLHPERFRCITDNGDFNFSRLMNTGAKNAKGEYLLLLNNDTKVIHSDWMTAMVEQAQFKKTGAVGARLLYSNNTIQHAGVIIGLGGIAEHHHVRFDNDEAGYYNFLVTTTNYSAVTAACLMVRKDVFIESEGFDEQLAIEFNDVDFCLKLKNKGYDNICLPHVSLYHYESISRGHPHKTKKSYERHIRDSFLFKSRWQKYIDHDPCYSPHFSRAFYYRLNVND
ncbi:MAG: glycosyltransferase family 2 protein [Bacteroidota bacterium]